MTDNIRYVCTDCGKVFDLAPDVPLKDQLDDGLEHQHMWNFDFDFTLRHKTDEDYEDGYWDSFGDPDGYGGR